MRYCDLVLYVWTNIEMYLTYCQTYVIGLYYTSHVADHEAFLSCLIDFVIAVPQRDPLVTCMDS